VVAEILQLDALELLLLDDGAGGLGDEDLAAVRCRADPGGQVKAEAEVALLLDPGLSRVEAHADTELLTLRPLVRGERPLRGGGGAERVTGAPERDEEGVALGPHLLAAVLGEGGAHERPVIGEQLRIAVAQPPQQPRRALDVAEEEGEGPALKLGQRGILRGLRFGCARLGLDLLLLGVASARGEVAGEVVADDVLRIVVGLLPRPRLRRRPRLASSQPLPSVRERHPESESEQEPLHGTPPSRREDKCQP
jgi:hypothetical protein